MSFSNGDNQQISFTQQFSALLANYGSEISPTNSTPVSIFNNQVVVKVSKCLLYFKQQFFRSDTLDVVGQFLIEMRGL